MERNKEIEEIIKLLDEYFDIMLSTVRPNDLDKFLLNGTNDSILSDDNNYKNLTFSNITVLCEIEHLYQDGKVSKEEADILECRYFEYLGLEKKRDLILYNCLMQDIEVEIPESLEKEIQRLRDIFNRYGIEVGNEKNNTLLSANVFCKKRLSKKIND